MSLLAALLKSIGVYVGGLVISVIGVKMAIRLTAVATLAAIYISCVVYYSTMIGPWLIGVFSTAYGALLGLLFPPVAGTVLASLSAYWICVAGQKYVSRLTKMAIG